MGKLQDIQDMAALIEKAKALGPMTDEERREQAASFAFGQLALTREYADATADKLAELRERCRCAAGCADAIRKCVRCEGPVSPPYKLCTGCADELGP